MSLVEQEFRRLFVRGSETRAGGLGSQGGGARHLWGLGFWLVEGSASASARSVWGVRVGWLKGGRTMAGAEEAGDAISGGERSLCMRV